MNIQEEILKSIELMLQKALEKHQTSDVASVVTEIKNNKYKVTINGADYWVKDGVGIKPAVGTLVWIHVPNGQIGNAYISARR